MCVWFRGWYFEDCHCVFWEKSWSCGSACPYPRHKILRRFLGICPNCDTMRAIPRDPNFQPPDLDYLSVPCDSQYDPHEVHGDDLQEHMRYHPWNIMIYNSTMAGGAGVWNTCEDESGVTYDGYGGFVPHGWAEGWAMGGWGDYGPPAPAPPRFQQNESPIYPLRKPDPPVFFALDGGYESDEDPVPPEYRYKR